MEGRGELLTVLSVNCLCTCVCIGVFSSLSSLFYEENGGLKRTSQRTNTEMPMRKQGEDCFQEVPDIPCINRIC